VELPRGDRVSVNREFVVLVRPDEEGIEAGSARAFPGVECQLANPVGAQEMLDPIAPHYDAVFPLTTRPDGGVATVCTSATSNDSAIHDSGIVTSK
jgi:hypothetical protein